MNWVAPPLKLTVANLSINHTYKDYDKTKTIIRCHESSNCCSDNYFRGGMHLLKKFIKDNEAQELKIEYLDERDLEFFVEFFQTTNKVEELCLLNYREDTNLPILTWALIDNKFIKKLRIGSVPCDEFILSLTDPYQYSSEYIQRTFLNLSLNNTITKLELCDLVFDSEDIICIGSYLSKNTVLVSFTLKNCGIDDDDLKIIANGLKFNFTLRSLNLAENNIEYLGLMALIDVINTHPTLTDLDLSDNQDITENEIRWFLNKLEKNSCLKNFRFVNTFFLNNSFAIDDIRGKFYKKVLMKSDCIHYLYPPFSVEEEYFEKNKIKNKYAKLYFGRKEEFDYDEIEFLTCVEFDKQEMEKLKRKLPLFTKLTKLALIECVDFS